MEKPDKKMIAAEFEGMAFLPNQDLNELCNRTQSTRVSKPTNFKQDIRKMEQASAMVKLILFYYTRRIDWESVRK